MTINTANIDTGMEVFDSDGEKLGKVESIIRDPQTESAMEQYRDAVNANVGTTAEVDDADASTPSAGPSVGSGLGGSVLPVAGSIGQGGLSGAGAAAAPGSASYGAIGAPEGTGNTNEGQEMQGSSDTGGYLHVKAGGLLGLGGKDLYVPMAAIQDMAPGDCITLNLTKVEAEERYANRPD